MNAKLTEILEQVAAGSRTVNDAIDALASLSTAPIGHATLDLDRRARCGCGEVIFAQNKTPQQVLDITRKLLDASDDAVLITRASGDCADLLEAHFGDTDPGSAQPLTVSSDRRTLVVGPPPEVSDDAKARPIVIVTAGTSDGPVAEEAQLTCLAMGCPTLRINDVGVAALQRILGHVDAMREAPVIICVAGMEAALPNVVGGLVPCPVIGVPTSVGYGTSFGGVTALLGMLNACASGMVTVNIDNGFNAAFAACKVHRLATTGSAHLPSTPRNSQPDEHT